MISQAPLPGPERIIRADTCGSILYVAELGNYPLLPMGLLLVCNRNIVNPRKPLLMCFSASPQCSGPQYQFESSHLDSKILLD